jgi:hypothetical protein
MSHSRRKTQSHEISELSKAKSDVHIIISGLYITMSKNRYNVSTKYGYLMTKNGRKVVVLAVRSIPIFVSPKGIIKFVFGDLPFTTA